MCDEVNLRGTAGRGFRGRGRRVATAIAASAVAALLVACGRADDTPDPSGPQADRMSYSSLPDLMSASEYAIVGHVIGSRNDVIMPTPADGDDPANPYLPGHGPTEEKIERQSISVVRHTFEVTDSLGSPRTAGETVDVDMMRGGLDHYTMTLHEGATYLLFVADESDDAVAITAVIEGVFWHDGDTFVSNMGLSTTPTEAEAFFK